MRGVVLHRGGAEDDRVSVLNEARALRELGHAAELDGQGAPGKLAFQPLDH